MKEKKIRQWIKDREIYIHLFSSIFLGIIGIALTVISLFIANESNRISQKEWDPVLNIEVMESDENTRIVKIKNEGHELKNFHSNFEIFYSNKNNNSSYLKLEKCFLEKYPTNNSKGVLFTYVTENLIRASA